MRTVSKEYEELKNKLEDLRSSYLNSILSFGKYKGKTLQWIKSYDRQYIYWLADNTDFPINFELLDLLTPEEIEAEEREIAKRRNQRLFDAEVKKRQQIRDLENYCRGNYW